MTASWEIREGDCVEAMAAMAEASVDAVVCDPPYGLEFMGREWDRLGDGFRRAANPAGRAMQAWHEAWAREALRVLKPGGHLLAFGGTRTYHRLAAGVEDAGFEIRDCVVWLYGSGFPKSLDVSKAIDRAAGAQREAVGDGPFATRRPRADHSSQGHTFADDAYVRPVGHELTAPATPEAERWDGWGTALKPAHEPIVVARKPLAGTVAGNVLKYGTGALNIDATRIGYEEGGTLASNPSLRERIAGGNGGHIIAAETERRFAEPHAEGRWPANVVLSHHHDCRQIGTRDIASNGHFPASRPKGSPVAGAPGHVGQDDLPERHTRGETVEAWDCHVDCPVRMLDEQTGALPGGTPRRAEHGRTGSGVTFVAGHEHPGFGGGASRFFYCAKASSAERGKDNRHPTVKPVELMRWLVRLVTPPGGLVLDPFAGSGTTGIAAMREGFSFVGIEREPDYVVVARERIRRDAPLLNGSAER